MMNCRALSYFALALSLYGCGGGKTKSEGPPDASTQLEPTSEILDDSLIVDEIAPSTYGGAWSRSFRLRNAAFWSVEKSRDGLSWAAVGFTDEDGAWLDRDVAKQAIYRFGGIVESALYEGLSDVDLREVPCDGTMQRATRVYLATGETITLGSCEWVIESREVVIDGIVRGFDPRSPGEGAQGPQITLLAGLVRGAGQLDLRGQNGRHGRSGSDGADGRPGNGAARPNGEDGANGGNGEPGGTGGRGGSLHLLGGRLEIAPERLRLEGGRGGQGGPAGAGGRGGAPGRWEIELPARRGSREADLPTENKTERREGKAGRDGAPGTSGIDGGAGADGKFIFSA